MQIFLVWMIVCGGQYSEGRAKFNSLAECEQARIEFVTSQAFQDFFTGKVECVKAVEQKARNS